MRFHRISVPLVLTVLLTLPVVASGFAAPLRSASDDAAWPALEFTLRPGAEPVITRTVVEPGALGGDATASDHEMPEDSECYVFAPSDLTCDGADAHVGNIIRFTLAFDPESASNVDVNLIQMRNDTAEFWYSCKVNGTLWLTVYLYGADCRQSGEPVFDDVVNVRMHLSHLPAAGRITVGGWLGKVETVHPEPDAE